MSFLCVLAGIIKLPGLESGISFLYIFFFSFLVFVLD